MLTSNDIYFSVSCISRGNTRIAQYLLMMYLTHKLFFFSVIDLVAARESIVLLRNTAGLSMTMESCWQMYADNLEENMSAPLMEAGQRGESVTRETQRIYPAYPLCYSKPCAL